MQGYSVIYSKFIRIDIDIAYDYIIEEYKNQTAANNLLKNILNKIEDIIETPYTWALIEDNNLASKGYRSVIINNFKLFYVIDEKEKKVKLIRFLHSKRDWANILSNDIMD